MINPHKKYLKSPPENHYIPSFAYTPIIKRVRKWMIKKIKIL
jgi:hypothetical protein